MRGAGALRGLDPMRRLFPSRSSRIVERGWARRDPEARSGQFRVVLADGLRIEIDPGFDAAELQRLIAALDSVSLRNGLRQPA
jgi:hypothetical protein